MSHTPGPWLLTRDLHIYGPDREGIADCNTPGAFPVSDEERRANAELIVAAPSYHTEIMNRRNEAESLLGKIEHLEALLRLEGNRANLYRNERNDALRQLDAIRAAKKVYHDKKEDPG